MYGLKINGILVLIRIAFKICIEGSESIVTVPKDEDNLEIMRKTRDLAEMSFGDGDDDEDESERLNIGDDVKLDIVDINDLNKPSVDLNPPPILEFEVLT